MRRSGALAHNAYMLSSKVIGRAGRRRGSGRRGHDGRAQLRAVWAMPRPLERPPASDGAVVAREARIGLSFLCVFGATRNGSRPMLPPGDLVRPTEKRGSPSAIDKLLRPRLRPTDSRHRLPPQSLTRHRTRGTSRRHVTFRSGTPPGALAQPTRPTPPSRATVTLHHTPRALSSGFLLRSIRPAARLISTWASPPPWAAGSWGRSR